MWRRHHISSPRTYTPTGRSSTAPVDRDLSHYSTSVRRASVGWGNSAAGRIPLSGSSHSNGRYTSASPSLCSVFRSVESVRRIHSFLSRRRPLRSRTFHVKFALRPGCSPFESLSSSLGTCLFLMASSSSNTYQQIEEDSPITIISDVLLNLKLNKGSTKRISNILLKNYLRSFERSKRVDLLQSILNRCLCLSDFNQSVAQNCVKKLSAECVVALKTNDPEKDMYYDTLFADVKENFAHMLYSSSEKVEKFYKMNPYQKLDDDDKDSKWSKESKCINSNDVIVDAKMNNVVESSNNKNKIISRMFNKTSSKVLSSSSISNSIDQAQNLNTITKSIVDAPSSVYKNISLTPVIKYKMLQIIIFKNYKLYHKKCIRKLTNTFETNQLLSKSYDTWHPDIVKLVSILLEDMFKVMKHLKFQSIIFMAFLCVLYRSIYSSNDSNDMYMNFIKFMDVINTCVSAIDKSHWEKVLPIRWPELFHNGCLIVDHILFSIPMTKIQPSMNWCELLGFEKYKKCYLNELKLRNKKLNLFESELFVIDDSSFVTCSSNTSVSTLSSDVFLVDSTSKTSSETAPTDKFNHINSQLKRSASIESDIYNDQKYDKKRKSSFKTYENVAKKLPSHYMIQQLHAQNMCLQIPKYSGFKSCNKLDQKQNNLSILSTNEQNNHIGSSPNAEVHIKHHEVNDHQL